MESGVIAEQKIGRVYPGGAPEAAACGAGWSQHFLRLQGDLLHVHCLCSMHRVERMHLFPTAEPPAHSTAGTCIFLLLHAQTCVSGAINE